MPQIIVRGLKDELVREGYQDLLKELAEVTQTNIDDYTLELSPSQNLTPSYPFIDVYWFDRGQEVQDEIARIITKHYQDKGIAHLDIIFHYLVPSRYYEDGKHF